jgi:hypothetical protein
MQKREDERMVVEFTYTSSAYHPQALVSFKKYMPPSLPYFKVNICPFPLLHFASVSVSGICEFNYHTLMATATLLALCEEFVQSSEA